MNKRYIVLIMILALTTLAACGGKEDVEPTQEERIDKEVEKRVAEELENKEEDYPEEIPSEDKQHHSEAEQEQEEADKKAEEEYIESQRAYKAQNIEKGKQAKRKKQEERETGIENDVPKRDFLIGKSDKDFKELTNKKPSKVIDDSTNTAKVIVISETVNINEYLVSYVKEYFPEDDLVHFIINLSSNTLTSVNDNGSYLFADEFEYNNTNKYNADEYDEAALIDYGARLGEYYIYKDNGDIVNFEEMLEVYDNKGKTVDFDEMLIAE